MNTIDAAKELRETRRAWIVTGAREEVVRGREHGAHRGRGVGNGSAVQPRKEA